MSSHQRGENEPQAVCYVQVVDGASLEIGSADVTAAADNERLAHELVEAFNAADLPRMRALLAEDLKAYITNAQGGIDEVDGPDELHNHAAHLLFIRSGQIGEGWMVEALPAETDEFWGS